MLILYTLARKFKQVTGMQFNEYLPGENEKLKLLRRTNMKISDVQGVGYSSTEYTRLNLKAYKFFSIGFKNDFLISLHNTRGYSV